MPRLSFTAPFLSVLLGCFVLGLLPFGLTWADDDDFLNLATEASKTVANPAEDEDEEINVQELLDETPDPSHEVASSTEQTPAEKLKKFLPFKIYQSTNNAFVRTLEKNGKVSRSYTPPICEGLQGSWEAEDGMLRIKEKIHCLVDPDTPGKYGRSWFQKVEFKLDFNKGKPTLNGISQSEDNVFRVN